MYFIIYEGLNVIFTGKSLNNFMFMLPHSLDKIRSHAGVQSPIALACQYVNIELFSHSRFWRAGFWLNIARIEYSVCTSGSGKQSFRNPPTTDSSGETIFPLSVLFQRDAKNVLWFVAAKLQSLPTGERPSNRRC